LFGREAECAAVEGLIAAAGFSRSGALVVRGEPGVGKSALLEHAIVQATKMRVLRWGGIEAESELAFAALHQLVRPILDRRDQLAEPQAASLAGALGLSRASIEDRFLIGVAVLSLLARRRLPCPQCERLDGVFGSATALAANSYVVGGQPVAMGGMSRRRSGQRPLC